MNNEDVDEARNTTHISHCDISQHNANCLNRPSPYLTQSSSTFSTQEGQVQEA